MTLDSQSKNDSKEVLVDRKFRNAPRRLKASGATDPINFSLDEAFDGSKKVKILIHGWKHEWECLLEVYKNIFLTLFSFSYKSAAVQVLKAAYLDEAEDINIIGRLSSTSTRFKVFSFSFNLSCRLGWNCQWSALHVVGYGNEKCRPECRTCHRAYGKQSQRKPRWCPYHRTFTRRSCCWSHRNVLENEDGKEARSDHWPR